MRDHSDLINIIAKKINAKTYLEIGVQNPASNFNKILVADKFGVDPDPAAKATFCLTSDEFFRLNAKKFDLIFCDGLHHDYQVKNDAINSWQYLNIGGVLVCHDANPYKEEITQVPRQTKIWTGNTYRTICRIILAGKFTVDFDYGCFVGRKNGQPLEFSEQEFTWAEFDKNRKELLNLVSVEDATKIIDSWK